MVDSAIKEMWRKVMYHTFSLFGGALIRGIAEHGTMGNWRANLGVKCITVWQDYSNNSLYTKIEKVPE